MDRSYKAPERVNVYACPGDKNAGKAPLTQVSRVTYSMRGYDNYKYDGAIYPGFIDNANGATACIFLSVPLKALT